MAAATTKGVRKLERPRPLRSLLSPVGDPNSCGTPLFTPSGGVGVVRASTDMLVPVETLCASLGDGNRDAQTLSQIAGVCKLLKVKGADMDRDFEGMLDRCFSIFRNASRDDELSALDRLRLLEVIELRAMAWKGDEELVEYYTRKYTEFNAECDALDDASSMEQARAFQQVQSSEQRPQMETGKPGTTTCLGGGQPKAPSTAADDETGKWERSLPVGTQSLHISGMNEAIVNVATSVLQTFFSNVNADAFCHTNQTPSCVPSKPAEALAGQAVAKPVNGTSGIANGSENKRFVRLESRTECTSTGKQVPPKDLKSAWASNERHSQDRCSDGLGSSAQIPGRVDKEHAPSTGFKTLDTASKLGPLEHLKGLGNPAQFSSGDDGRQFSAGFVALGSTGTHTQLGQCGRLTGSAQFSSDTENQKLDPSGDFKGLASGDATDKSKQLSNLWGPAEHFSTSDKRMLPTKALGNTDVPDQSKQLKGLGGPAQFSSKADDKWQPLSNTFTATSSGASGQNQTMKYERLGASVQSPSSTEYQTVPFSNKSLGGAEGASKAQKHSTPLSSNAVEHGRQAGVKALSVNGLPAEKEQPKVLESSAKSGNSASDDQVPKRTLSPNHKVYSREFLMQCSRSSLATQMPPDFPLLDPEVASAMVRKDRK
ncbi:uncharacterized protein LOC119395823 [Rhipicephalus sanguineus]|uniref:uncharacterized protein LOC119395823 n=1 Tax=Rhipicephalus sanguineus TaxID=34632 RepID=UPI001892F9C9|nr:uncharacterized protein LOC119395823 [Rhipicephalus sanguineus]